MLFTDDMLEQVRDRNVIPNYLSLPLGASEDGTVKYTDLCNFAPNQHMLLTGAKNSGKSSYLRFLLTAWSAMYGSQLTLHYLTGNLASEDFVWDVGDLGLEELDYYTMQHCLTSDTVDGYLQMIIDHVEQNRLGPTEVVILDDCEHFLLNASKFTINKLLQLLKYSHEYAVHVILVCKSVSKLSTSLRKHFCMHSVCSNMYDSGQCFIQADSSNPELLHVPNAWYYMEGGNNV